MKIVVWGFKLSRGWKNCHCSSCLVERLHKVFIEGAGDDLMY